MGFCLFNNVAVAAAAMLARGLERIAIVDIDVHHGNGTQAMFYEDPRVLYVSTHQFPFYPGTGAADEIGAGEGRGFTVNVPMEAGSTDADYALVHPTMVVSPCSTSSGRSWCWCRPGYDAHERDPLASMRMTTEGYARSLVCCATWRGDMVRWPSSPKVATSCTRWQRASTRPSLRSTRPSSAARPGERRRRGAPRSHAGRPAALASLWTAAGPVSTR